jgi:hypothetical protein
VSDKDMLSFLVVMLLNQDGNIASCPRLSPHIVRIPVKTDSPKPYVS